MAVTSGKIGLSPLGQFKLGASSSTITISQPAAKACVYINVWATTHTALTFGPTTDTEVDALPTADVELELVEC